MAGSIFSRVYNPLVDDFDAIVAAAHHHVLVGVTLFSSTAIRLDFAPNDLPGSPAPARAVLPPYIAPPKHH
jgi:hypothetical protein